MPDASQKDVIDHEITEGRPAPSPKPPRKRKSGFSTDELAAIKEQLKAELVQEMKDEQSLKMEEARQRREEQKQKHQEYIEKMKASPEPWVEVIGMHETDKGVRTELEWNDAFVDYLRANGVSGVDDDQVVQKWITLLLRDMADQMEGRFGGDFE